MTTNHYPPTNPRSPDVTVVISLLCIIPDVFCGVCMQCIYWSYTQVQFSIYKNEIILQKSYDILLLLFFLIANISVTSLCIFTVSSLFVVGTQYPTVQCMPGQAASSYVKKTKISARIEQHFISCSHFLSILDWQGF